MHDDDSDLVTDTKVVPLFPERTAAPPASEADELVALGAQARELLCSAQPVLHPPTVPEPDRCDTLDTSADRDVVASHVARWRGLAWPCTILSWALALTCIYVTQHFPLPPRLYLALRDTVYLIAGANVLGFWIASMDKAR